MNNLIKYIKKNLSKGYTVESLRWALVSQGYSRVEIDKAVKLTNEQLALQAPKLVEKPIINIEVEPKIEQETGFWQKIKNWFS